MNFACNKIYRTKAQHALNRLISVRIFQLKNRFLICRSCLSTKPTRSRDVFIVHTKYTVLIYSLLYWFIYFIADALYRYVLNILSSFLCPSIYKQRHTLQCSISLKTKITICKQLVRPTVWWGSSKKYATWAICNPIGRQSVFD